MKLIKEETQNEIYRYEVEVDENFINYIKTQVRGVCNVDYDVTPEVVKACYQEDWDKYEELGLNKVFKVNQWFEQSLGDFIRDCINEYIWDSDSKYIDGEVINVYDDILED